MKRSLGILLAMLLFSCGAPRSIDPGPSHPIIEHVARQEVLTPLPLRVRLPASSGAEHVIVLFRPWGARTWREVELARRGQTWSGEISCRDVSTITGDTKYYFLVLDGDGDVVGGSGSEEWPHVATIIGTLPEGPQGLPGRAAPMRCHDPADCPPDFPGCPGYAAKRRSCRSDRDCGDGGLRCAWDGYCGRADGTLAIDDDDAREEQLEAAVRSARNRRATAKAKSGRESP